MFDDDHISARIREVLKAHARLAVAPGEIAVDADLYEHGMTSLARVDVMLGLEDAFDVEFPNRLLKHSNFASIASMVEAVREIMADSSHSNDG